MFLPSMLTYHMPRSDDASHTPFYISLGTPTSEASAAAAAAWMQAVVAVLEEAQNQLGKPGIIHIRARPFTAGSLEIPLDLVVFGAAWLLTDPPVILNVLDMFKSYIELRKLIGGGSSDENRSKSADAGTVNQSQVSTHTMNIMQNCNVTNNIHIAATEVMKDRAIEHVAFLVGEKKYKLTEIGRDEMPQFQEPSTQDEEHGQFKKRTKKATLIVRTAVLKGKGKWTVEYNKRSTEVKIADESFLRNVEAGEERFASGDRLEVDLEITEEFDSSIQGYTEKGYTVTKVHSHSPRPDTTPKQLFGDEKKSPKRPRRKIGTLKSDKNKSKNKKKGK